MWHRFPLGVRAWMGIELTPVSHAERLISAVGGFIGIFCILLASWKVIGDREAALLIVGSMGASAVLVFAVPHGPLSQPWAVIGGHTVSAIIGVACARAVPYPFVAAALAVGTAIGAMHYLRCIHPPGGATAIAAVIGGSSVKALGYGFVVTPVLLNVAIILATAIAVNRCVAWRRYPTRGIAPPAIASDPEVSEGELARVHQLASTHTRSGHLQPHQIHALHFYSNGHFGAEWSIRKIVESEPHDDPSRDVVHWLAVDGNRHPPTGSCSRSEFALWAHAEVFRDLRSWSRVRG